MKERNSVKHISKTALGLSIALVSSSPESRADQPQVYGEYCKVIEYTPAEKYITDIFYFPGINGRGEMLKAESRRVGDRIKNHTLAGFGNIFEWTRNSEHVAQKSMDPKYMRPGGLRSYVQAIKSTLGQEADCSHRKIDKSKFFPPAPNPNKTPRIPV